MLLIFQPIKCKNTECNVDAKSVIYTNRDMKGSSIKCTRTHNFTSENFIRKLVKRTHIKYVGAWFRFFFSFFSYISQSWVSSVIEWGLLSSWYKKFNSDSIHPTQRLSERRDYHINGKNYGNTILQFSTATVKVIWDNLQWGNGW